MTLVVRVIGLYIMRHNLTFMIGVFFKPRQNRFPEDKEVLACIFLIHMKTAANHYTVW
jgi:hypothetical protein